MLFLIASLTYFIVLYERRSPNSFGLAAEWIRLEIGRAVIPYRGFESLSLRH